MKTRVGVIRGGLGYEYDVSLRNGGQVLNSLPEKFKPVDILVTKDGQWHSFGIPIKPADLLDQVDVVFNALHGEYGEDGQIQAILDNLNIPYTGSNNLASALTINKLETKKRLQAEGLSVPYSLSLNIDEDSFLGAKKVFTKIAPPWIIKPVDRGSSVGVIFVKSFTDLPQAIENAFSYSDNLLVEQYIKGREATCGVIDNFRQQDLYSLSPVEIIRPNTCPIWTYDDKYSLDTRKICPGNFSAEEAEELRRLAMYVHKLFNLRHYSRTDFIVSPRGIYILENNSLPALTPESPFSLGLEALGVTSSEFLDHILTLALLNK